MSLLYLHDLTKRRYHHITPPSGETTCRTAGTPKTPRKSGPDLIHLPLEGSGDAAGGIVRVTLANLAYNMHRLIFHERLAAMG